ncbi:hypothetical protein CAP47_05035 [Psychroflexus sp. S27]|nr:hypothetical protein CAP47_05035 [Psychroflexus sp. S27]
MPWKKNWVIMNNYKKLTPLTVRIVLYALAMLSVALIIKQDFANGQVLEEEMIEIFQEVFLILAVIFSLIATRFQKFKIFNYAMAGMLMVHFIREFDFWLNYNLFDYAWQILALVVFIPTVYLIISKRKAFIKDVLSLSKSYGFGIFIIGFLTLHVFSRLFGSKKIWNWLMEPIYMKSVAEANGEKIISLEDFVYPLKTGAQEGIELFAYLLILIGVIEMFISKNNAHKKLK